MQLSNVPNQINDTTKKYKLSRNPREEDKESCLSYNNSGFLEN